MQQDIRSTNDQTSIKLQIFEKEMTFTWSKH